MPTLCLHVRNCESQLVGSSPDERWQNAGDLTRELKWIGEGGGRAARITAAEGQPRRRRYQPWLPWAASLVLAVAIAGATIWSRQPVQQPLTRFAIALTAGQRFAALDQPAIAISPDGKNIV